MRDNSANLPRYEDTRLLSKYPVWAILNYKENPAESTPN